MKIWSKLFLVAATGMMMFSSCLENIEPEGIADLRGAKAELLRAQTALAEANAAKVNAEAAIALAKAKVEEAIAKQEEALAKKMEAEARIKELEAAKQEALDAIEIEKAMAEAKAAIAEAEALAAVYAAELERDLLLVQAEIADAQATYEKALKNLELAKNGLTAEQKAYLEDYIDDVETWQADVDRLSKDLSKYSIELKAAIANLDASQATAVLLRQLEVAVIKAEAKIAGAEESVAILEAAMELDPQATDWAAEKDKLQAKLDAMEFDRDTAKTEKEKEAAEWREAIDELREAYEEYEDATGFDFEEATGEFSDVEGDKNELPYPNINVPSPKDEDGVDLFRPDFKLDGFIYYTDPTTQEVTKIANISNPVNFYYKDTEAGSAKTVVEAFDEAIEDYEDLADATTFEATIAGANKRMKDYQNGDDYKSAFEKYEALLKVYADKTVAAYYAEEYKVSYYDYKNDTQVTNEPWDGATAAAEYNAALAAVKKTYADYNKAMDDAKVEAPEYVEITKVKNDSIAAADARKFAAYQKAQAAYREAYVTYDLARLTYNRATAAHQTVMDAANYMIAANTWSYYTSAEATNADPDLEVEAKLKEACDDYAAYVTEQKALDPEFEEAEDDINMKALYAAQYNAVSESIKTFKGATNETSATAVWTKAQATFAEAQKANGAAIEEADKAYKASVAAADEAYNKAEDKLAAGTDPTDPEYVGPVNADYINTYLKKLADDAKKDLQTAMDKITKHVRRAAKSVKPNAIGDTEEDDYVYTFADDYRIPSFFVDENSDLKEIKAEDLVDVEYFKNTVVKSAADEIASVAFVYGFNAYNAETYYSIGVYNVVPGAPADYPLSLPTYESYKAELEEYDGNPMSYAAAKLKEIENDALNSGGNYDVWVGPYYNETNGIASFIYNEMDKIAAAEESIANTEVAAEHVKVLEAAKAEFEAWAAEEEARIDALGAKVVAEWNEVYPQLKEMLDAEEAYNTEKREIERVIGNLKALINKYVEVEYAVWDAENTEWTIVKKNPTDGDIEAFVKALQEAYDAAVIAVGDYEAELADAKTTLEKAKAGEFTGNELLVKNVKTAQANYDKAAAELEYAMSRLAEATEALKDAMEAIGAVEPEAEETPAE